MAAVKQLKTVQISETWPDIYNKGYMHQFQSESTHNMD